MSVFSLSKHLTKHQVCAEPWTLIKADTGQTLGTHSLVGCTGQQLV